MPLLVLTTQSSLARLSIVEELWNTDPVFVVVDMSLIQQVRHRRNQKLNVKYTVLETEFGSGLQVIVLAIREAEQFTFIYIGLRAATWSAASRLDREFDEFVSEDPAILEDRLGGVNLALDYLRKFWHLLI